MSVTCNQRMHEMPSKREYTMKNYRLDIASLLLAALLAACCASLQAAPPGPEIVVGSADPDEALRNNFV